jgi:hypothetical protein
MSMSYPNLKSETAQKSRASRSKGTHPFKRKSIQLHECFALIYPKSGTAHESIAIFLLLCKMTPSLQYLKVACEI